MKKKKEIQDEKNREETGEEKKIGEEDREENTKLK